MYGYVSSGVPETVHLMMRRFESSAGALEGGKKMKNYLVTIKIGKVITNKLVKAETAEEAEKEALKCASQETTDLQTPN